MNALQEQIIHYIPSLRRHARILTGSQDAGDQWVEHCLEEYTPSAASIDDLKHDLFQAFHRLGQEVLSEKRAVNSSGGFRNRLRESLHRLPPVERQLLLLVVLEGFSAGDAAQILGISPGEAQSHLSAAWESVKSNTPVPILIIEDEPLIAMDLAQIVQEMGYMVIGTANREDKAIQAALQEPPALILADIQLLDGDSGIRAVQEILRQYDVPVIFVTGYPERLLAGQTPEPTYVVTKPFDPDSLKVTIEQALSHHAASPTGRS